MKFITCKKKYNLLKYFKIILLKLWRCLLKKFIRKLLFNKRKQFLVGFIIIIVCVIGFVIFLNKFYFLRKYK